MVFVSCTVSKHSALTPPPDEMLMEINDGSSFKRAVLIDKSTEIEGTKEEYEWLAEKYPGYTFVRQDLVPQLDKYYDVIEIKTASNVSRVVIFDITSFCGKP